MLRKKMSDRKREILDRALELFLWKGYEGTSAREIAEACNISKANLYHHFSSKEELLHELLSQLLEAVEQIIGKHSPDGGMAADPAEALEDYVDLLLGFRMSFLLLKNSLSLLNKDGLRGKVVNLGEYMVIALAGPDPSLAGRARAECALGAVCGAVSSLDAEEAEAARSEILEAALRTLDYRRQPATVG